MNEFFERNPGLKTPGIVLGIIITLVLLGWGINRIWYWNFDTESRPGKVVSVSWQMDVNEYYWKSVSHSDWHESVPDNAHNEWCYNKSRTISVTREDGTSENITYIDTYCEYYLDEWVYQQTYRRTGTDKNPVYVEYPENTSTVEYREVPGVFTVTFSSVEYVRGQFSFNYDRQTWDKFQTGMRVTVGVNKKGKVPFRPELPR